VNKTEHLKLHTNINRGLESGCHECCQTASCFVLFLFLAQWTSCGAGTHTWCHSSVCIPVRVPADVRSLSRAAVFLVPRIPETCDAVLYWIVWCTRSRHNKRTERSAPRRIAMKLHEILCARNDGSTLHPLPVFINLCLANQASFIKGEGGTTRRCRVRTWSLGQCGVAAGCSTACPRR
jgi:hypothetical protein